MGKRELSQMTPFELIVLIVFAEAFLDGEPHVVVRDGEIVQAGLQRDRLTRAEILTEMRLCGIFRLEEVAWAILEPRGKMSFICRSDDKIRSEAISGHDVRLPEQRDLR